MLGDPWPEEPPDPFEDPGDPESRFELTIPDDADVSAELYRTFWGLVIVFNVALLATALGALLITFRGDRLLGGGLLALGLVSLGYGVWRYRRYRTAEPPEPTEGA